jgi:hypothetical protein
MNCLDSRHIRQIEEDVESARITINNLSQELVDHICCEVESLMSKGKSFDEAYAIIREQAGLKVLQQIQENTLYLTDKTYKTMKTTMKITGNVSLAFIAIGTLFKIMHWPGASPILILGFFTLCFIFFPAAIYLNYNYRKDQKKPLLNLSIGIGGVTFMVGVLFKLMHWPGAALLLFAGWTIILGIFLPLLLFVKLKEAENRKEKNIYILGAISLIIFEVSTMFKMFHWPGAGPLMLLGGLLLIVVFLPMFASLKFKNNSMSIAQFIFLITTSLYAVVLTFLLAMNVTDVILDRFVRDEAATTKIVNYYKVKAEVSAASNDSTKRIKQELAAQVNSIAKLIRETKVYLITQVEGVNEATAEVYISNPDLIKRKDNYDAINKLVFGDYKVGVNMNGEKVFTSSADPIASLKDELTKFRNTARAAISNSDLSKSINALLNTSDGQMGIDNLSWQELNFGTTMLISAMAQLSELEKNVRLVESVVNSKI